MSAAGFQPARLFGVNLLATGTQIILPRITGLTEGTDELFFLPLACFAVLRTMTGPALTTAPKFRIGGNANHNDVIPLFTVPLAATVGQVAMPSPVAPPFTPPNVRNADLVFEITVAGVGPTAMLGDLLLLGFVVSGS
jgi:hypothetical protein